MHTETRNAEQIWRYIFRALGAVFSFFMYDTYQQVREIKTGVDDLKIMVAETKGCSVSARKIFRIQIPDR